MCLSLAFFNVCPRVGSIWSLCCVYSMVYALCDALCLRVWGLCCDYGRMSKDMSYLTSLGVYVPGWELFHLVLCVFPAFKVSYLSVSICPRVWSLWSMWGPVSPGITFICGCTSTTLVVVCLKMWGYILVYPSTVCGVSSFWGSVSQITRF